MRLTFLSHFILCLAVAAGAFFATITGVTQMVWVADQSMMTSVIAALFVVSSAVIGRQAWLAELPTGRYEAGADGVAYFRRLPTAVTSDFGHLAEGLAVRFGLIGTGVGIMLTIKAALASASPLAALQTAFISMVCGVAASCVIAIMTFNLEQGIKKGLR